MSVAPTDIIARFAGLRVLVIGEAILDSYLDGPSGRLCREAPVPIVTVASREDAPGGAANTAANVAALGAGVRFLSVVGDDPEGHRLLAALRRRGVPTEGVFVQPGRRTLAKHRVSADGQLLVRFDQGETAAPDRPVERRLIAALAEGLGGSDAVIVSDYGYGVLSPAVLAALAGAQARNPRLLVADSKNLPALKGLGVTAVKPNYGETVALLGGLTVNGPGGRVEAVTAQGERLLELTGSRIAAVTLDCEGALVLERGRTPYRTYARPAPNTKAAGAGDTYVAALTLALAAGADTPAAAELAGAAAAVVVGKSGTSDCTAGELLGLLASECKLVPDRAALSARVEYLRKRGKRIVFTNGCFDILHRGHVTYLSRAKALADVLIVGLNTDAGIRRLKGPGRPVNGFDDRAGVLSALSCVDAVVPFDEPTPAELIKAVRPDVYVKGGDYADYAASPGRLPEAALVESLGGRVEILPLVADRSTTGIIEKIRASEAADPGGRGNPAPLIEESRRGKSAPPTDSEPAPAPAPASPRTRNRRHDRRPAAESAPADRRDDRPGRDDRKRADRPGKPGVAQPRGLGPGRKRAVRPA